MKTRLTLIVFSGLFALSSLRAQIRSDFVLVPQGRTPDIVLDNEDRFHLTWRDIGIHYGIFDSLGNQKGEKQTIAANSLTQTPRLAVTDENVVVVWTSFLPGFFSYINGLLFNRTSGNIVGTFNNSRGDNSNGWPDVSYLIDSTFVVVWSGDGPSPSPTTEEGVYGQVLTNSLSAASDTLEFTDDLPEQYTHFHPIITKNKEHEGAIITWVTHDTLMRSHIFGRRLGNDGLLTGSNFRISKSLTFTKAWGLSGVMDADGNFTIGWSAEVGDTLWNVYLRRFQANGSATGPAVKISENNVARFAEVDLALDYNETMVTVWEGFTNDGLRKIIAQRFAANGAAIGTNFQVSILSDTTIHVSPSVVLNRGRIFTVWSAFKDVYSRSGALWANILDFDNPVVSIGGQTESVPIKFQLLQNYPNPFNPNTTIKYHVPQRAQVQLIIYNVLGEEVITLINAEMLPGDYEVRWRGTDSDGMKVPSGVYIYKLSVAGQTHVKRMALVR